MGRRERWGVAGAILAALDAEEHKGANARLTSVAARANIAYDRLQSYLVDLERQGLVRPGRVPTLTQRGKEFLRSFTEWESTLERFGFVESSPVPSGGRSPAPDRIDGC